MSHNINKIIYINLKKRTDRKIQIETELNNFDLSYERFEAIETNNGIVGCGFSHLNVLKLARDNSYENILILEDDFTFVVSKEEFETQLTDFFNLQIDYDVCMISYNLIRYVTTPYNCILKALDVQTASGYIVNKKYYSKLIDLYEVAIPLLEQTGQHWIYANDQIWKQYQEKDNWYCFSTRIGRQLPGYSDISKSQVNYIDS
jgi:GR25 family glycosyltransferase involved in LPS biosynthesis